MGGPIKIYDYLEFLYFVRDKFTPNGVMGKANLRRWIAAYFGSDYRTVKKHFKMLLEFDLIREQSYGFVAVPEDVMHQAREWSRKSEIVATTGDGETNGA